jgi:hypothetical protein
LPDYKQERSERAEGESDRAGGLVHRKVLGIRAARAMSRLNALLGPAPGGIDAGRPGDTLASTVWTEASWFAHNVP